MATRLRDALGPWAVSGPALSIGRAALSDGAWLDQTLKTLEAAEKRLDRLLETHGCTTLGGTRLFRLISHPAASHVADTLCHHGILVRRFDYQQRWLRFGLPSGDTAWKRLEDALRKIRDDPFASKLPL